ncbi:MCE family protein [Mycobacterium sp. E1747]|uniref:MCE family protein n=1 Tax=Mycobacterium sp. E1747 TaxID=1834128 RepID=UPI0007FD31B1|nr:MCE family protein [Mycobacterium sp. E1747]OBH08852.1 mammalian cell entry protein [Mycobacterium sp. E1747]
MNRRPVRLALMVTLAVVLVCGAVIAVRGFSHLNRSHIVAYFDNSNGLFRGDEVRMLGVPIGEIESVEPQPERAKIRFWIDKKYKVPADAKAVIVSPQLITSRAIQLTPAYTGGPQMSNGAVIPQSRTAVPVEWDELREQLKKLTDALQPTQPGGVSTLGEFINTGAANLRGQGANIRDAVIKLSQAFSVLGDHSNDVFSTIKNLSTVVSALKDSATLLAQLNRNLAVVTGSLAAEPDTVGAAVHDLNAVVGETTQFIANNRETLGTMTDRLASLTSTLRDHIGDIKQSLHSFPNAGASFVNIYQPTQMAVTGGLALQNMGNPITFLCGAIEAASRLNSQQAAKLCVQYLAPIIKNRQYNFPPIGENLVVGEGARPNEIDYSENWLRPDHVPGRPAAAAPPTPASPVGPAPQDSGEVPTNPAAGLSGMMVPANLGGGS